MCGSYYLSVVQYYQIEYLLIIIRMSVYNLSQKLIVTWNDGWDQEIGFIYSWCFRAVTSLDRIDIDWLCSGCGQLFIIFDNYSKKVYIVIISDIPYYDCLLIRK